MLPLVLLFALAMLADAQSQVYLMMYNVSEQGPSRYALQGKKTFLVVLSCFANLSSRSLHFLPLQKKIQSALLM